MDSTKFVQFISSFIPFIIVITPFVVLIGFIARRKGKSITIYCVLGCIPIVNAIAALWLASLTDCSISEEIEELKKKVDGLDLTGR